MEKILLRNRIGVRIFQSLLLVAVIAVVATSLMQVLISRSVVRENVVQRNLQIARRAAGQIELYIDDALTDAVAVADTLQPIRDPWVRDILLEKFLSNLKRFRSLELVDETGRVAASSRLEETDYFRRDEQISSALASGSTMLSDVKLSADNLPYLTIARPVFPANERRYVLVADLDLRKIWEMIDDISFSRSGTAVLISRDRVLIAHPDKTRVLTPADSTGIVDRIMESPERSFFTLAKVPGKPRMLFAVDVVPTTMWYIVIQQEVAEAYQPVRSIILQTAALIGVLTVIAVIAAFGLARTYSRPLARLVEGTQRIGNGNLAARIEIESDDEIGALSRAFNVMVADLQLWSERLRQSEEKYRHLTENINDIIFLLEDDGTIVYTNERAVVVSGYTLAELQGRNIQDLVSDTRRHLWRAVRSAEAADSTFEVSMRGQDGRRIVLEVRIVSIQEGHRVFYGVARDITDRKATEVKLARYQANLRSLASQLSITEARERQRIASEIHDNIGQSLAVTRIKLGILRLELDSTSHQALLAEALGLIEGIIQDTRNLIFEVSSPLLYEVGLEAALERLAEQFRKKHGIDVRFRGSSADSELGIDTAALLFGSVRELLFNVVKHAKSRLARITVVRSDATLSVTVEDDGVGFDSERSSSDSGGSDGFGLFSIRERIGYIGGSMDVDSVPGSGTRIVLSVPVRTNREMRVV